MRRDPMAVLEAAYDLASTDEDWMVAVLTAMHPLLERNHGVYCFTYKRNTDDRWELGSMAHLGGASNLLDAVVSACSVAQPEEMGAVLLGRPCQSISRALAPITARRSAPSEAVGLLASMTGCRDQLAVIASDGTGGGCAFVAPIERSMRFPPRSAGALSRLARHIAAARRLRNAVARTDDRNIDADAVLSPKGQVLHAGSGTHLEGLQTLSNAARLLCESRKHLRDADPEQALRLWTALIDGQWSIVDTLDTDGKRLLLARRNVQELYEPRALTADERHVLMLASRGHSLSLLAYELGLPQPRVSERLSRALRKLGVRSRAELVRYFGPSDNARGGNP